MPPGIMKMVPGTRSAYPSAPPVSGTDAPMPRPGRRMPPSAIPPTPSGVGTLGGGSPAGIVDTPTGGGGGIPPRPIMGAKKPLPPLGDEGLG